MLQTKCAQTNAFSFRKWKLHIIQQEMCMTGLKIIYGDLCNRDHSLKRNETINEI